MDLTLKHVSASDPGYYFWAARQTKPSVGLASYAANYVIDCDQSELTDESCS